MLAGSRRASICARSTERSTASVLDHMGVETFDQVIDAGSWTVESMAMRTAQREWRMGWPIGIHNLMVLIKSSTPRSRGGEADSS